MANFPSMKMFSTWFTAALHRVLLAGGWARENLLLFHVNASSVNYSISREQDVVQLEKILKGQKKELFFFSKKVNLLFKYSFCREGQVHRVGGL